MSKAFTMIVLAAFLAMPPAAFCQPDDDDVTEVVVTATRLETPVDEVSGTILVISADEIEEKQAKKTAESLKRSSLLRSTFDSGRLFL